MDIPVRNIYYMILYAFDKVKHKDLIANKTFEATDTISDVIVALFLSEVTSLVRQGLYRNYQSLEEPSLFIRGKINIKESIKHTSSRKIVLHDDFNGNNVLNQIIKYTLHKLMWNKTHPAMAKEAKLLYYYFNDIEYRLVDDILYQQVFLNKQNREYDFALQLSIFINKRIIPDNQTGSLSFIDILEDEETMSTIYEAFLRNFYRIHTPHQVRAKEYQWYLKPLDNSTMDWLPKMRTDIEITPDPNTKIIIDAKFYKNALYSRYEAKKFSSANMYQMNTYLMHNIDYPRLRGILLYPSVGYVFHQKFESRYDFSIEFDTVDLNQEWSSIQEQLLDILDDPIANQTQEARSQG
jgi:5-methylcytosine-specific restriction enzyme subunit McrC